MLNRILVVTLILSIGLNIYQANEIRKIGANINELLDQKNLLIGNLKSTVNIYRKNNNSLHSNVKDKNGNTPSDVLSKYMSAKVDSNYRKMFELLDTPKKINYIEFKKDFTKDNSIIKNYKIEDYIMLNNNSSIVYLTYELQSETGNFKYYWEPWGCIKINETWKVKWLSRQ